jgi:hypothetical protein
MTLTDSIEATTEFTQAKITAAKADLGLADVWRGDQQKLPRYPACCVIAGPKNRELNGMPRKTLVTLEMYVQIYHGAVSDVQLNDTIATTLTEAVETLLHADSTLGGLVIDSMVNNIEPGYANKAGTLVRATRLTFLATSQVLLPMNLGGT